MKTLEEYILKQLSFKEMQITALQTQIEELQNKINDANNFVEEKELMTYQIGETLGRYYSVGVVAGYDIGRVLGNNSMTIEDLIELRDTNSLGSLIKDEYCYLYEYKDFAFVDERVYKGKFILGNYTYVLAWDRPSDVNFIKLDNGGATYFSSEEEAFKYALEKLTNSVNRYIKEQEEKKED